MQEDVAEIQAAARRAGALAAELEGLQGRLRRGQSVRWVSDSADRFRVALRRESGRLQGVHDDLEAASAELRRHARAVEDQLDERRAGLGRTA